MKPEPFVRSFAWLMLLGGACGPEEIPPLEDPNTFAGMSRAKIENACYETVQCNNTPGEYEACVSRTADVLEKEPDKRLNFLTNYARCSAFKRCEYVMCTTRPVVYGESQRAKVNYTCQQTYACDMLRGGAPASGAQTVDYCTATCQAMNTCDFVACFMY
jgi:hypothetical protein